jgi:hypothetical protein
MKTLKESILTSMEDTLDKGLDDATRVYLDLDGLPTVKDFAKAIFNNKWHEATWYCPNVLNRYKGKYNIIPKESDSISIVIDASYGRVCDVNLYFTTGKGTKGATVRKKTIRGWNEGLVGSNLRNYKNIAISILLTLAHNPEKLETVLDHATKYTATMDDTSIESFHERTTMCKIRNLFELLNK